MNNDLEREIDVRLTVRDWLRIETSVISHEISTNYKSFKSRPTEAELDALKSFMGTRERLVAAIQKARQEAAGVPGLASPEGAD